VNAEQTAYWNNDGGLRWSSRSAVTERVFAPLTAGLMARARPVAGERVLDVGCGCGATSVALAQLVGPHGDVLGADISRPMLEVARNRDDARGLTNLEFAEADASTHPFEAASFDLAVSQFGVMFFDDPIAAFANIRRAVAGGRLAFICWREPSANPWQTVPARAADGLLPPGADRTARFSFADPERVRVLLGDAGFHEIEILPHDADLPLGATPEEAASVITGFGALGPRMVGISDDVRRTVLAAVAAALGQTATPEGVTLRAGTWIVTARG
jgi:SAM-dependent methyltransferase